MSEFGSTACKALMVCSSCAGAVRSLQRAPLSGPTFHRLRVTEVTPLTDEAVAVTFDVPPELSEDFAYRAGQHVTVRADIDGADVRRSYSICSNANDGKLRIGVKRLPGGAFSTWATSHLRAGVDLEVMPPVGEFVVDPEPRHYGAVVAGSGITPVLSVVSTTLEAEPGCHWTVIFGNRSADQVMFLDELEGLKDRYPDRLQIVHILSREQGVMPLFTGRIDEAKMTELLDRSCRHRPRPSGSFAGRLKWWQLLADRVEARGLPPDLIHDEFSLPVPLTFPASPPSRSDKPAPSSCR